MKICSKCEIQKPLTEYSWKSKPKQLKHAMCKDCCSHAQKHHYQRSETGKIKRRVSNRLGDTARRQKNREFIWNYLLQNPCGQCGEKDPLVLEFDHRDREAKLLAVSSMVSSFGIQKIKDEIAKCDVLCAHCHRRKTAKQLGWWIGEYPW